MKEGNSGIAVMSRAGAESRTAVAPTFSSRNLVAFSPNAAQTAEGPVAMTPQTRFKEFSLTPKVAPKPEITTISPVNFITKGSIAPEITLNDPRVERLKSKHTNTISQVSIGYNSEQTKPFLIKPEKKFVEFIPNVSTSRKGIEQVGSSEFQGELPQIKELQIKPQEVFVANSVEPIVVTKPVEEVTLQTRRKVADTKQAERVLTAWRSMLGEQVWKQEERHIITKVTEIIEPQKVSRIKTETSKKNLAIDPREVAVTPWLLKFQTVEALEKEIQTMATTKGLEYTKEWLKEQQHPLPLESIFRIAIKNIPLNKSNVTATETTISQIEPRTKIHGGEQNIASEEQSTSVNQTIVLQGERKRTTIQEQEKSKPKIICFRGDLGQVVNKDKSEINNDKVKGKYLNTDKVVMQGLVNVSTPEISAQSTKSVKDKEVCLLCLIVVKERGLTLSLDTKSEPVELPHKDLALAA